MITPARTQSGLAKRVRTTRVLGMVAMLALCMSAQARLPDNLDAVQRESRIMAQVLKTVMREAVPKSTRVTKVDARYLAEQGVLVTVSLNTPWITVNNAESGISINGEINLTDVPPMITEILSDLHIDIAPYEPAALEELRELRSEQRSLRLQQRELRGKLRAQRRALVRSDDESESSTIEVEIDQLEGELEIANDQYEGLSEDIGAQYERLRDYRDGYQPTSNETDSSLDDLVAQSACDYGPTLKSLSVDEHLTFALDTGDHRQYFVFDMSDVFDCGEASIQPARLLERAYRYSLSEGSAR